MLRHHVVAELVDVAHHLGQRRRLHVEARCAGGRHAVAHHTRQFAAHVAPQGGQQPVVVAAGVGVGHRPGFHTAGGGQAASQAQPRRLAEVGPQLHAPVLARPAGQRHRGVHAQAVQRRLAGHRGDAVQRVGREAQQDRLVVQQQRVGAHVVRPQRLAVEVGRVLLGCQEGAAVEHDVAANVAHAELLHAAQQQPQAFDHQLRVSAALDDQVAVQHAVAHHALQPHRRAPAPRGAQQFERGAGGDQLHQRGRIDRLLRLPGQARAGGAHFLHHRHQRLARQPCLVERRLHFGGQAAWCGRRQSAARGQRPGCEGSRKSVHASMIARRCGAHFRSSRRAAALA